MSSEMHGRTVSDPCDPPDLEPRRPDNRPGLTSIHYRIGRHGDFVNRMLWGLPREAVRDGGGGESVPLKTLSARTTDDPAVALIDAFATTLDVLTFYQERIVNEAYLRTATERSSLLELSRTIGYELRPGVAASANLAFTVEDADDPFRVVTVPAGTQVMSVPDKPDARPQIFETVAPITARAEWNAIPARTERPQNIAMFWHPTDDNFGNKDTERPRNGDLFLLDLDSSFDLTEADADDVVTIDRGNVDEFLPVTPALDIRSALDDLAEDRAANPDIIGSIRALRVDSIQVRGTGFALQRGLRVLVVGIGKKDDGTSKVRTRAHRIESIAEDNAYGLTWLQLQRLEATAAPPKPVKLKFTQALLPLGSIALRPLAFNAVTANTVVKRTAWSGAALSAFVKIQSWPRTQLMLLVRRPTEIAAPRLGEASPGFYVLRQSVGFFGNAAPKWETLAKPDDTRGGAGSQDPYNKPWEPDGVPVPIYQDSQGISNTGDNLNPRPDGADVFLEREVAEAVPDGWTLFENPTGLAKAFRIGRVQNQSRADFSMSGKTTGLVLVKEDNTDLAENEKQDQLGNFNFRSAVARIGSQPLPLGGLPIIEPVEEGAHDLTLDGFYLDMEPGEAISIAGERADAAGIADGETLIIEDVQHLGGFTRLSFSSGTTHSYKRTSLRANANVAPATHGERGVESLGSGDATLANQAFKLTRAPLTFVSAATDSGRQTTLAIRVDGVTWSEVEALYDAGPEDQVYAVRIDDEGATRVVFGDGIHGKRLPTGSFNVAAGYRSGMGVEGEVAEETLTLLKTRPLGVRGVTNLSAARGAAPPEALEDARLRGPQSVRTLGRIVSLTDYEDFARSFAGIGKAKVTALWRGRKRIIHLTVAPAIEGVLEASDKPLLSLADAIERRRDPGHKLIVSPHAQRYFRLQAKVVYDPRHQPEDLERTIAEKLGVDFGYAVRPLAEPVVAAGVIATIQNVPGVVYVDLNELAPYGGAEPATSALASVLRARPAHLDETGTGDPPPVLPAELLAVIATGIDLTMEADHA